MADPVYVIRVTPYACVAVAVADTKKAAEASYKLPDRFAGEQKLIYVGKKKDLEVLGEVDLVRLHNQMTDRHSFSPIFTTKELGVERVWAHLKELAQVQPVPFRTHTSLVEMCEELGVRLDTIQLTGLQDTGQLLLTGVSVEDRYVDKIIPIKISTKEATMVAKTKKAAAKAAPKATKAPAKAAAKKAPAAKAAAAKKAPAPKAVANPTITRTAKEMKFNEGSLRSNVYKLIGAKIKMDTLVAKAEKAHGLTAGQVKGAVGKLVVTGGVELS